MEDNGFFICTVCGEEHPRSECSLFDDQILCLQCLSEETTLCDACGRRICRENNAGSDSIPLCQSCYDNCYTNCIRCGAVIRSEDAHYNEDDPDGEEPFCDACDAYSTPIRAINDYYYKPTPIFYGKGSRFFGVELEMDGAGELSASAQELLDIGNVSSELIYCKHDGSLDDGFEVVTHPMTYDYHHDSMPWAKILNKAVEMGYSSHRARTCGLHIHINRTAFGTNENCQEACIARVLYFFEKHWEELLKFSRRTEYQLMRWAARYGYKEQPMAILDHAKSGYGGGRYSSVNLQNTNTIEFRIFRGTLKYNTLIATLQMVDRICDVAISMSDEELKAMSWTTFMTGCRQPELVQYLKERRLYINEPVKGTVEF